MAGFLSMINQAVAQYKILARLGESELSEVYLAEDAYLSRQVAIKFLAYPYAASADFRERFKQEAQAAALINHPNSVTIYEVGEFAGRPYIVMEYVGGESLSRLLARREPAIHEVIDIALQIGEGLRSAHSQGIWHRDIKPDNILLDSEGRVKIVDFGLAKLRKVNRLTLQGTVMGTPPYMSPEQVLGEDVDQRADIFSLGVVLYEMIARQKPFKGETWEAISYAILHREPEPLARYRNNVSANLQRLIDKALDKNRASRYQNIESLLVDLKREKKFLTDGPQAIIAGADRKKWPGHFSKSTYGLIGIAAVVAGFFLTSKFSLLTNASNGKAQPLVSAPRDSAGASNEPSSEIPALHPPPAESDSPATAVPASVRRETSPLPGSLFVDSQPGGADIFLDHQLKGKTPQILANLPAGVYAIVLRKEGYQDSAVTVAIKSGEAKNLNPQLMALPGRVRILIAPTGTILVDGALHRENTADWHETRLAPGTHQIKMIGPNGVHHEQTVAILPNETKEIKFDFTQTATLTVTAKDEMNAVLHNVAIYLDGKATGKTAPRQFSVPVGYHTVTVRLDGFTLIGNEQSLDLEAGQTKILSFILRKMPE